MSGRAQTLNCRPEKARHGRDIFQVHLRPRRSAVVDNVIEVENHAMSAPAAFAEMLEIFKKNPLGLQLFTVGDAFRDDPEETLIRIAKIGYQAVELPGLPSGAATRFRMAADNAGLSVTSVHIPAEELTIGSGSGPQSMTLSTDIGQLADDLHVLGACSVVVPLPTLPTVRPVAGETPAAALTRGFRADSGAHWKKFAALLNERAAQLKCEGITLSYHNHNFEFAPFGDTSGWDILMRHTEPQLVYFELDVGWVAAAGLAPVNLMRSHRSRIRQLHLKDLLAKTKPNFAMEIAAAEVGYGMLDWKPLLEEADRVGVREFYVEQEPPFKLDRFDSIAKSFRYISTLV